MFKNPILMLSLMIFGVFMLFGCADGDPFAGDYPNAVTVTATNPADVARTDAAVKIGVEQIKAKAPDFNPESFVIVDGTADVPSQLIPGKGKTGESVMFLTDLQPNEQKTFTLRYSTETIEPPEYTDRAQAVLAEKTGGEWNESEQVYEGGDFVDVTKVEVPDVHTDHSTYYRMEGPGWESDKVGYRLYLDHRNAIDIYGKKVTDMVLDTVGLHDFERYHHMAPWGMDILSVGDAFGVGSVGIWKDGSPYKLADVEDLSAEITTDGSIYSQFRLDYNGVQVEGNSYDVTSWLSIAAGSRLTNHTVQVSDNVNQFCAGLVKHGVEEMRSTADTDWRYLATYGTQTMEDEKLGMVLFYRTDAVKEITQDDLNYYLVMEPKDNMASFYFGAAWEKEPNGVKNKTEFLEYLNVTLQQLNNPISVNLN
ncbi:MAG: DUF4861 domain-containing protein [Candidatus Marinimicrobia bacterium]|nr:DUF4861 domain-containing protein [Candidatus Neomarinimicrobiota bacterium]MCF7827418.1 DUF4861 domain-containing protein [Candidatus Neomarinimicrobiota bacterium]MCF7881349.1 DUF4861 domain-containing protein [Candidatus Neomarinimicrobiota bacterium]